MSVIENVSFCLICLANAGQDWTEQAAPMRVDKTPMAFTLVLIRQAPAQVA
jgi:hypothetical protein